MLTSGLLAIHLHNMTKQSLYPLLHKNACNTFTRSFEVEIGACMHDSPIHITWGASDLGSLKSFVSVAHKPFTKINFIYFLQTQLFQHITNTYYVKMLE